MKRGTKNGSKPGPKGKGIFRIVEHLNPSGRRLFRVTGWTITGERIRQNYRDHASAAARLAELEIETANLDSAARPVVTRLAPDQIATAETAYAQLAGKPLLDAVRYYLDNYRAPVTRMRLTDAFEKFIAERRASNLRPASLRSLQELTRELRLVHGDQFLSDIGSDTLRPLIFKDSRKPVSADGYRRAIHAFFAWATEQGFCANNPMSRIKPVKSERHDPQILTVDQTRKLLTAASSFKQGALLPYVALAVFAGLRPTELARLTWERIDLAEHTITIGAAMAKMRAKRIVAISENLVAWLRPYQQTRPPIVAANWRKDFAAVKQAAGWGTSTVDNPDLKPWTQDVMRHTAISYHLARFQHEGQTATWAGNSPTVIQQHYKGLVKQSDAREFWNLTPDQVAGNILQLPTQAVAA